MLTAITTTIDSNAKIGYSQIPLDIPIGGQFPYLTGTSAGSYSVPANTKLTMKSMCLSVSNGLIGEASRSQEVGAANAAYAGVWSVYIGASQLTEWRQHCIVIPNFTGGSSGDEMVNDRYNTCQSPSIGEGIVVSSGTAVEIRVVPNYNTNTIWTVTLYGKIGTAAVFREAKVLTATTTSKTLLSYTPPSDFTLLGWTLHVDLPGQTIGQATIQRNGMQFFETPYLGCGESTSNMFDGDSFAGSGQGALILPLWNMEFYPGDLFQFTPIPLVADYSRWYLTISGTESSLSAGGVGATSFAY